MLKPLNYFLNFFIGAFIMYYYSGRLFSLKRTDLFRIFSLTAAYSIQFCFAFLDNSGLNIIIFLITNSAFLFLTYDISPAASFFHSGIAAMSLGVSELLVGVFNKRVYYDIFDTIINTPYYMLISLISKLIYFILLVTLLRTKKFKKDSNASETPFSPLLFFLPLISCSILICFCSIYVNVGLDEINTVLLLCSTAAILLINILIFIIYDKISVQSFELANARRQLQLENDKMEYFKSLRDEREAYNITIHDIKKNLQTISDYNAERNHEKINEMLKVILGSSSFRPSRRVSDNSLLNSIVGRYISLCEKSGISFEIDIRSKAVDFLSDFEMTALFYNLLDNAYEAAGKCESDPYIDLQILIRRDIGRVEIILKNSCKDKPLIKNSSLPATTKNDKSIHGYGLKSIEKIVKAHAGHMQCSFDEGKNEFTTLIMMQAPAG